jgi:hypothetical protein
MFRFSLVELCDKVVNHVCTSVNEINLRTWDCLAKVNVPINNKLISFTTMLFVKSGIDFSLPYAYHGKPEKNILKIYRDVPPN